MITLIRPVQQSKNSLLRTDLTSPESPIEIKDGASQGYRLVMVSKLPTMRWYIVPYIICSMISDKRRGEIFEEFFGFAFSIFARFSATVLLSI